MTHEQLIEAQLALGKAAIDMMLELSRTDSLKSVDQNFGFFEEDANDAYKMTIERVEK